MSSVSDISSPESLKLLSSSSEASLGFVIVVERWVGGVTAATVTDIAAAWVVEKSKEVMG